MMIMFNFLRSPLIQYLFPMDQESMIFWSYMLGVIVTCPVWAWVTMQYTFKRTVERWLLCTITFIVIVHALLFIGWYAAVPVCLLSILVFGSSRRRVAIEIAFVIVAHWLTAFRCHGGGTMMFYFVTAFFIITTVFFNLIFRYPEWKQWVKGEHVCLVPSYMFSYLFMIVMQFHFTNLITI